MSEEDKDGNKDGGNTVTYTEAETLAMKRNWKPRSEWEGDPKDFVDAPIFNRMGEMMDRISSQTKELREVKGTIDQFKKHSKDRDKIALKRAREQLLADKAIALEAEEFNRVVQIDEDIKEADKQIATVSEGNDAPVSDPFKDYYQDEWVSKNSWYTQSKAMRNTADDIGDEYMLTNPGATPKQLFDHVTSSIKEEFPHKFKNPNRDQPGAVGSSKVQGRGERKASLNLTDEEYEVGMRFVKQDLYKNIEEYAAELNDK